MTYLMQAVSSGGGGDGLLKSWTSAVADFGAAGFPGPGTAAYTAVAYRRRIQTLSGEGVPVFLVTDYGAVGDGSTDDTVSIQAAIDACELAGGVVQLGRSHRITATLVINGDGVTLRGRGSHVNASNIYFDGAAASCKAVKISGQLSGIEDVHIVCARIYSADAALEFDQATLGFAYNVQISYAYMGINVYRSSGTRLRDYQIAEPFGPAGVWLHGEPGAVSFRLDSTGGSMSISNQYDGRGKGPRATTTAYVQGDLVTNGSYIWQCSVAGTTSGGAGPTAIPTSDPTTARTTNVTDGTASWRLVGHAQHAWFLFDSYANTLTLGPHELVGGSHGLRMLDQAGLGATSRPMILLADRVEIDHPYTYGMLFSAGFDITVHNSWIGDTLYGSGIWAEAAVAGELSIRNTRVFGSAEHGMAFLCDNFSVQGCRISANSLKTANVYSGIVTVAGLDDYDIVGNVVGDAGLGTTQQAYGINNGDATNDNFVIANNRLRGNVTAGLLNPAGTSATKVATGNTA